MNSKVIGKVEYNNTLKGTCFLVSKSLIFTAEHVVRKIEEDGLRLPISCIFKELNIEVKVTVEYRNQKYDIAILKIIDEENLDCNFYNFAIVPIEKGDEWETEGYPGVNLGEKVYVEGKIRRMIEEEEITKYELAILDQKDETDWTGISGAPLIIDNEIAGVILEEEEDNLKSRLIVIATEEILDHIKDNRMDILDNIETGMHELLKERMIGFQETCEEIFYTHTYTVGKANINYHILKRISSSMDILIRRLMFCIRLYGIDLITMENARKGNFMEKAEIEYEIDKKRQQVLDWIKQDKEIVYILLWILIEGVKKYPRIGSKIRDKNSRIRDIFIDDKSEVTILLGIGDIQPNLKDTIMESLKEINDYVKEDKINITDEIFLWDDLVVSSLKYASRSLLNNFQLNGEGINVKIAMISAFEEEAAYALEEVNERRNCTLKTSKFIKIMNSKQADIDDIVATYSWIANIDITCFIVPFRSVEEFQEKVMEHM